MGGVAQDASLLTGLSSTEKWSKQKTQVLHSEKNLSRTEIFYGFDQRKSPEYRSIGLEGPVARRKHGR